MIFTPILQLTRQAISDVSGSFDVNLKCESQQKQSRFYNIRTSLIKTDCCPWFFMKMALPKPNETFYFITLPMFFFKERVPNKFYLFRISSKERKKVVTLFLPINHLFVQNRIYDEGSKPWKVSMSATYPLSMHFQRSINHYTTSQCVIPWISSR